MYLIGLEEVTSSETISEKKKIGILVTQASTLINLKTRTIYHMQSWLGLINNYHLHLRIASLFKNPKFKTYYLF